MYIKAETLNIGDKVVLDRDFKSLSGTFTKGSIVTITDICRRGYAFEDSIGNRMIECGFTGISKYSNGICNE